MALDADGYPLEESLKAIENFDLLKGLKEKDRIPGGNYNENLYELLRLVHGTWSHTYGLMRVLKSGRLYLVTGGWSGNEDTLDALGRNGLFWGQYFYNHRRGGHWTFEIPRKVAARLAATSTDVSATPEEKG